MIEFDKEELEKLLHNMTHTSIKLDIFITSFFKNKQVVEVLDNNDFKKFYEIERFGYHGPNTGDITTILYLSDIDPLKYLDFIPKNCFTNAPIKLVDIPSNIKQIKDEAFTYCHFLESIIIPDSVEYIESYVFHGCERLREIYYSGTIEEWSKIIKSEECFSDSDIKKIICLDGVVEVSAE